jgi:hypothetical protein
VAKQTLPSLPPEKEHFTRPKAERIFIAVLRFQSQFFRHAYRLKTAVFLRRKKGIKSTNWWSGKRMEQDPHLAKCTDFQTNCGMLDGL